MKTVTIERLGHHGDGIAPGPIYVPRALPGEVVTGQVENDRMNAPKILTPVSERVRPPCRHYKNCGGCSLQHAADGFVEGWKKGVVETALRAQGLPAPMRQFHTSPPQSRRRATIAARRLKKGAQVGFHGIRTDTICEIDECQLLRPELLEMLPLVRDLAIMGVSRKGRLAVTLTLLDDGMDVAVNGGRPMTPALYSEIAELSAKSGKVARLSWEGETVAAFSTAQVSFGPAKVCPPPGSFLQATLEGEKALVSAVTQAAGSAKTIADLFAGCGTFALPLAANAMVHAVEGSKEMLAALSAGWRGAKGLKTVSTEARDLFQRPLLTDELNRYGAVVVDPPRAGAEAQMAEIAKAHVPVIVMVSCNPATFARDAKVLIDSGYSNAWIDIVDQFRWSSHIELVACFLRDR
ncbi:MAG: class I SAM-dependent RNA methyltransferase [Rhodobacteraceae bacterium]|nr:class I SAM-dependent RNA methyltransferase [Paracoccaceae bacterium]